MHLSDDQTTRTTRILNPEFNQDHRRVKRHRLQGHVLLGIPYRHMICGTLIDISTGGISLIVPTQLPCGQGCRVLFSVPLGTEKVSIDCIGIVENCVCTTEGFRVGMRFIISDVEEQKALEQFFADWYSHSPSNSTTPPIRLDPPAVVNFASELYPKTVRISDLGKR